MRSVVLCCLLAACGGKPAAATVGNQVPLTGAPDPTPTPAAAGSKLALTSLSPPKGDANGGTYVVLHGTRFIADGPRMLKIYFGSTPGLVIRFQSDSQVIVQAPAGNLGDTVDIRAVFDPGGEVVLAKAFTFVDKADVPAVDDSKN